MNTIGSVLERIVKALQKDERLRDVRFVMEYPKSFKQTPLLNTTVLVGLFGIEMEPGAFSGYCGSHPETGEELYARRANMRVKLEIFVPLTEAGVGCMEAFSLITDRLLESELEGALLTLECGEVGWDQKAGAYRLPVTARIKAVLGSSAAQETAIDTIIERRAKRQIKSIRKEE